MSVSGIKSDFTFKNSEHFIIIWRDSLENLEYTLTNSLLW